MTKGISCVQIFELGQLILDGGKRTDCKLHALAFTCALYSKEIWSLFFLAVPDSAQGIPSHVLTCIFIPTVVGFCFFFD